MSGMTKRNIGRYGLFLAVGAHAIHYLALPAILGASAGHLGHSQTHTVMMWALWVATAATVVHGVNHWRKHVVHFRV